MQPIHEKRIDMKDLDRRVGIGGGGQRVVAGLPGGEQAAALASAERLSEMQEQAMAAAVRSNEAQARVAEMQERAAHEQLENNKKMQELQIRQWRLVFALDIYKFNRATSTLDTHIDKELDEAARDFLKTEYPGTASADVSRDGAHLRVAHEALERLSEADTFAEKPSPEPQPDLPPEDEPDEVAEPSGFVERAAE